MMHRSKRVLGKHCCAPVGCWGHVRGIATCRPAQQPCVVVFNFARATEPYSGASLPRQSNLTQQAKANSSTTDRPNPVSFNCSRGALR